MAEDVVALRFIISGRVQGVFYRASTAREAARLGIRGHAINLPDGRVEVLAIGAGPAVEELRHWLWRGPPAALVTAVEGEPAGVEAQRGVSGFRTG